MKKILALVLAVIMIAAVFAGCGKSSSGDAVKIAVLVPNADHGWTGAVMTYAQEHAKQITGGGKYTVTVITSTDASNQIHQVEDLIANKTATHVVILPQDNTL